MLIALQKSNASHVAGLRAWNQLGRSVKKGEKGIVILAPVLRWKEEQHEEPTESTSAVAGFRAAYVFDRLSRDLRPSLCVPDRFRQWMYLSIAVRHIIAQLLCPAQRSLMQEFQLWAAFVH